MLESFLFFGEGVHGVDIKNDAFLRDYEMKRQRETLIRRKIVLLEVESLEST